MKRRVAVGSIVGVLGLVACATPNSNPTASNEASANRKIAQAGVIQYTTDSKDIAKVCGHAPDTHVSVGSNQYVLTSQKDRVSTVTVIYPDYGECEATESDGRTGDWKGYYNAPADERATRLAAAVKGVGKNTAPYLVPYFNQGKPRSWRQFSDLITTAANEMEAKYSIDKGWTKNVLVEFKADNIVNLGYVVGSCQPTTHQETYEVREHLGTVSAIVEASVESGAAKLLPGECESFGITFNGTEVAAKVDSAYNTYGYNVNYDAMTADYSQGRKITLKIVGKQRLQPEAPYFIVGPAKGSPITQNGSSATIALSHPDLHALAGVPEFASACKVSASGAFYAQKGNAANGKKDKASTKVVSVALDMNSDATNLSVDGIQIKDPKKQHIGATVSQVMGSGCPFYSAGTKEVGKW